MNKTKIVFPMLSLLLVGALASCSGEPEGPKAKPVTEIRLSRQNLGLNIDQEYDADGNPTGITKGEEFQLEVSSLPRQAVKPVIKFSSTDEKVATVDENGLVKAIAKGECEIVASNEDGTVKKSCPVFVGDAISKSQAGKIADKIKTAQESISVDTVYTSCYWNNKIIKNDVVQQDTYFDREMIISRSNAYFKLFDKDTEIKVAEGSPEFSDGGWIIYTNEYFDTYLFHDSGDVKTFMVADSTSYISAGKTRFDAMCAVLDSLFTSGSKIATNLFEDVLGAGQSGPIGSANTAKRRGSNADDQLNISISESGQQQADRDDEEDYYIPAGTIYDVQIDIDYVVDENFVKAENVYQGFLYTLDEDNYENAFYLDYAYEYRNVELDYPDYSLYQRVDTIFDL